MAGPGLRGPARRAGAIPPALGFVLALSAVGVVFGLLEADDRGLIVVRGPAHHIDRARTLQATGRPEEALLAYARAEARGGASAQLHLEVARTLRALGWLPVARARLDLAVEAARRDVAAYPEAAGPWTDAARRLVDALVARADLARRLQDADPAVADLEEIVARDRVDPNGVRHAPARFWLARVAAARGRHAEALHLLDGLVAEYPGATFRALLHHDRATLRLAAGETEAALEDLGVAISTWRRDASLVVMMDTGIRVLVGQPDADPADPFTAAAIQAAGVDALVTRARLLAGRGDAAAARADLDAAARLAPERADIRALRDTLPPMAGDGAPPPAGAPVGTPAGGGRRLPLWWAVRRSLRRALRAPRRHPLGRRGALRRRPRNGRAQT